MSAVSETESTEAADTKPSDAAAARPSEAPGGQKPSEAAEQMKKKAAHGAGWAIALGLGSRVLTLVGSILMTHLLDPDVMGEVGVAVIVVTMMNTFSTLGYGHYVLSKPKEGPSTLWHITVLHLATGVIALGAVLLLNAQLASWMNAPALVQYLPWVVLVGVLERLLFVPERVLIRTMQFKRVATTRSVGELSYMLSALGLVALGFGGFAVVLANVVRSALKLLLFAGSAPRSEWLTPHKLSKEKYREILRFSLPLALTGAVYYAASRWDNLIISMIYGPALMGQYNVAYNLAALPAEQIGEQAEETLLPSLTRVSHEERPQVLFFATGMLSFIIFPVSIGLGLVATTAANAFIGPKWDVVGQMMTILCVLSIARPLSHQVHAYMLSEGKPRALVLTEVAKLVALVALLLTLGRVSPSWACVAVGIAFFGHALIAQRIAARTGHFPMTRFFAKTLRPLAACIPLVLGVLAVRWALSGMHLRVVALVAEIVAGAIGYGVGTMLFARQQARELVDLVKKRKARPAAQAS